MVQFREFRDKVDAAIIKTRDAWEGWVIVAPLVAKGIGRTIEAALFWCASFVALVPYLNAISWAYWFIQAVWNMMP